jgi:hypothetical protein
MHFKESGVKRQKFNHVKWAAEQNTDVAGIG